MINTQRFKGWMVCLVIVGLVSGMSSCVSTKKMAYFQSSIATDSVERLAASKPYIALVHTGDVLNIQVSSLNPEATTFFNPYRQIASFEKGTDLSTAGQAATTGYRVDETGKIEFPLLGSLDVANRSTTQIQQQLRAKLGAYLKEPTVSVRLMTFRISVMGEVARPGLFTIPNEQITLSEALSMAGDMNPFGRRDNVTIVREENGQKTFARLDLTKRDWIKSPYYNLHPNDIVYVEPSKARAASLDKAYMFAPALVSVFSFLVVLLRR